ncbi:MAG: TolB family protein [Candidatus Caldatribacteriaceae bacterium]
MKKSILINLIVVFGFFAIMAHARASERLFFADYTQDAGFSSLQDFLTQEGHFSVMPIPEPFLSREETSIPAYWEKLSLLGDLLFIAYERDNLVFVQLIDLHLRQEILSLVRKKENEEKMRQELKEKMRRALSLEPGIKIIFPREENGRFSLVTVDPQGKKETILAPVDFGPIEDLSMSPDAQFLAFTANHGYKKAVYLFHLQDRSFQSLSPWEWNDFSPSFWEKDRKIVFVSERNAKKGIFTMNLDGSRQNLFLEKENPVDYPALSGDGQRFIYCELTGGKWTLRIRDLFSQKEETLDFGGNVLQPAFTPDGRKIVFVGEIDGNYDLYMYSILEKNIVRLTVDNFPKAHPAPSPDGRWIAFRGQKEGNNWDIFVLDLYKRNLLYRLTSSLAREGDPVFTPYPIY